jgi:hypothetical protein
LGNEVRGNFAGCQESLQDEAASEETRERIKTYVTDISSDANEVSAVVAGFIGSPEG